MIRINTILPVLLALCINVVHAQDWFSKYDRNELLKGYVIGIAGDTIPGLIQFDYPVAMQKQVFFLRNNNADNSPVRYGPADIRGYGINDNSWISTRVSMETYDGPYEFARFGMLETIPGPVVLLRIFEEADKKKKKLNSDEASRIYKEITYEMEPGSYKDLYIKKQENQAQAVFSKEFKKSFTEKILGMVGEHQELKQKILDKSWGYRDLEKIVNEFNRWHSTHKP